MTIVDLIMLAMNDEELPKADEFLLCRDGVDFIPASIELSAVEAKLQIKMGAERFLESILRPFEEYYDYILIDTCPFFR